MSLASVLEGLGAKMLGTAARCVRCDETSRFAFEGSLVRNARFGGVLPCANARFSDTEPRVSHEMLILKAVSHENISCEI